MSEIIENLKYSYNDVSLVPSVISEICHRSECDPFIEDNKLPIFTAPMTSVVNVDNFSLFEENHIIPILPRNIDIETRIEYSQNGKWAAYSLSEFEEVWCAEKIDGIVPKVLIDVANGHMACLYELVKTSKKIWGSNSIVIMVGNIANPETYRIAAESGADYIRCGIGGGDGCSTSTNTSLNFPQASLVNEIGKIKSELSQHNDVNKLPKIIADGGIRNYSDVIKAIALGADYVMIGGVFSKMVESASLCKFYSQEEQTEEELNGIDLVKVEGFENKGEGVFTLNGKSLQIYKLFYGMASRLGQKDISGEDTKVPEGIVKMFRAEYTMNEWVTKMLHYLRSAMSYTNSRKVYDLQNTKIITVTTNAYYAVNR